MRNLSREIEDLRQKMNEITRLKGMDSKEFVKLSARMDELVSEYYKLQKIGVGVEVPRNLHQQDTPNIGYDYIGWNIEKLSREKGISRKQLAELIGITDKHLYKIITGKQKAKMAVLVRIARTLGVSINIILE